VYLASAVHDTGESTYMLFIEGRNVQVGQILKNLATDLVSESRIAVYVDCAEEGVSESF
jgi:hypothetical protein